MKFTQSEDGELTATIQVRHRIGRGDLVDACAHALDEGVVDVPENPSRAWLIENLRAHLQRYGTHGAEADVQDMTNLDRAEVMVNGAFPELTSW